MSTSAIGRDHTRNRPPVWRAGQKTIFDARVNPLGDRHHDSVGAAVWPSRVDQYPPSVYRRQSGALPPFTSSWLAPVASVIEYAVYTHFPPFDIASV